MLVDDFDFELPPERIAQHPADPREDARLLHITGKEFRDHTIRDLSSLLRPGDLLISNNTRVIPARLTGSRPTRNMAKNRDGITAKIEVTLHMREAVSRWRAFARPAKKANPGDIITFAEEFFAEVLSRNEGEVTLQFNLPEPELMAALNEHGIMPLPPYIKRDKAGDVADLGDYQTLFATRDGAVAAPTAGLHFTDKLLSDLKDKGIDNAQLTLHVGAGTFLPVKVEDTNDHVMHSEWAEITAETAQKIDDTRARGGRIVAVGTTSLRTLESAAAEDGSIQAWSGFTDIFITPGYQFKIVDVLMTNFHLPRSTLFMLISAFVGLETMQAAYEHAISSKYRFYSYGDACLLERTPQL